MRFTANSRTPPLRPIEHRGTVRRLDLSDPARLKAIVSASGTLWTIPFKMLEKI